MSKFDQHYEPTRPPGILDTLFVTTGITSVSGKAAASYIKLIPNPASATVQVLTQNQGMLKVIDAQGRQVLEQAAKPGNTVLDVSGLKPGIYSVMVEGAKPERLVVRP